MQAITRETNDELISQLKSEVSEDKFLEFQLYLLDMRTEMLVSFVEEIEADKNCPDYQQYIQDRDYPNE